MGLTPGLKCLESLYQRGARLFKFVDRTFNLNIKSSLRIMQFFLDKLAARPDDPVFAHFEVVPDHLPDALKAGIQQFPAGDPFGYFMALSDWLYGTTDSTHRIALERLAKLVADWLVEERGLGSEAVADCLKSDYAGQLSPEKVPRSQRNQTQNEKDTKTAAPERQARHIG